MRWNKKHSEKDPAVVVARVVQQLVGSLYEEQGAKAVNSFITNHIHSRTVDVASHLKLNNNPKQVLRQLLKDQNKQSPVSRMLKETGRLSTNPVFIVGVYSGIDKLGEGYGSSIAMAETRACKNALERHFTKEIKDVQLPADLLEEANVSFMMKDLPSAAAPSS
ncbi:hypothetical protein HDU98_004137 [Podochytrium sp. JEL0797]|nr:hypothetical protein HDU98_004137 [Podochytrium sp. JEL0797]